MADFQLSSRSGCTKAYCLSDQACCILGSCMQFEIAEKQLEHGRVYVQLLKDVYSEPLFSLNCNMEKQEVASQIKVLLEVYIAGDFLDSN